jgi:hypothetical protein
MPSVVIATKLKNRAASSKHLVEFCYCAAVAVKQFFLISFALSGHTQVASTCNNGCKIVLECTIDSSKAASVLYPHCVDMSQASSD